MERERDPTLYTKYVQTHVHETVYNDFDVYRDSMKNHSIYT